MSLSIRHCKTELTILHSVRHHPALQLPMKSNHADGTTLQHKETVGACGIITVSMGRWIRGPDSSCCYDDPVVKEQLAPFPSAVNPSSGFVLQAPAVALSQGGALGALSQAALEMWVLQDVRDRGKWGGGSIFSFWQGWRHY